MTTYSSKHYGAGKPDCPICGGLGYISYDVPEDHPDFGRIFDCECRTEQVTAERIVYLQRLGGLEHLSTKTFSTFNPDGVGLNEKQQANLQRAFERALAYAEAPEGWLVIMGGYGCGKTHLAAAIANARIEEGQKVLFVTVPDLLDHLRSAFSPTDDDSESYSVRFELVRTISLLVLDDLGIESPTPWATEKLYQIVNYRYTARLPTVITSNHDLQELDLRLRSRISDLEVCEHIAIITPDYRHGAGSTGISDLDELELYTRRTFDHFEARPGLPQDQQDNLSRAYRLAEEYAANPKGWLVLMGPYGCGKTHLAAAIANANRQLGRDVLFITVPDLLDHLRATYAPNSQTSYDKRFNQIKTASLLILDDLGTEAATSWAREKLYQLINYRYNAQLPTVITTSHELEDLDPRLVARMRDQRLSRLFAILAPAYLGPREQSDRGR